MSNDFYFRRHPVLANIAIIFIVAVIGLIIIFISLNIFTRHGESKSVPDVENMSFTNAINILHDSGFLIDIRDSVFKENVSPGYVVEQFPKSGSKVKPGRKIFLYINAVHPREYIIDPDRGMVGEALKGYSLRQGLAKLEELGFKKINIVKIPGDNDRIIRLLANGKTISKMEKVPVTSMITVEVFDGMTNYFNDSIRDEEYYQQYVTDVEEESFSQYPDEEYTHSSATDEEFIDEEEPAFVQ